MTKDELRRRVIALVEELGEDVGFEVIAHRAGCTFQEAYEAYLGSVIGEVETPR